MTPEPELIVDLTTSVLAGPRSAGMSRVEREFARGLAARHTAAVRFVAWSPTVDGMEPLPVTAPDVPPTPSTGASDRRLLLATGGGWLSNPAYLHALARYRDALDAQLAVVIHDVLPIIRPHWFTPRDAARNSAGIGAMLALADGILVYSDSTHADLEAATSRLHLRAPEVRRITLGTGVLQPSAPEAPPWAWRLADRPFVLFVSTISHRKNHEFLCNVWRRVVDRLGARAPRLLLVGRAAPDAAAVVDRIGRDPELDGHVDLLADVDDATLTWLYEHCQFTVYPSLYEGWGLPVTESLSHGKVCITADTSSLREAAAGVAPLLDPYDHAAWLDLVCRLVDQPETLAALESRLRGRPVMPTWAEAADSLRAAVATPFDSHARLAAPGGRVWSEGADAPSDGWRVTGHGRYGYLVAQEMRANGVALSANVQGSPGGSVELVVNGTPVANWPVGAVPAHHDIHLPAPVLATRAVLDIEVASHDARGDVRRDEAHTVTADRIAMRPLTPAEHDVALARHRLWWNEGDLLRFGSGQRGAPLLVRGWNSPAEWGVWTEGSEAVLEFAPLPAAGRTVHLRLWTRAFVLPQAPALTVDLVVDGTRRDTWHLQHPADAPPCERILRIDDAGPHVRLCFQIRDPRAPHEIGLGSDTRRLGLGLMCAQWLSAPPPPGDRPRGLPPGVR